LVRYEAEMQGLSAVDTETLARLENGLQLKIGGVVTEVKEINTRKGDRMSFLTLEDMRGSVEVVVFPALFHRVRPYMKVDMPVLVGGILDKTEDRLKIRASSLVPLDEATKNMVSIVHIRLRTEELSKEQLLSLRDILEKHRGSCEVLLHLMGQRNAPEIVMALPPDLMVNPSIEMIGMVEGLFGARTVEVG